MAEGGGGRGQGGGGLAVGRPVFRPPVFGDLPRGRRHGRVARGDAVPGELVAFGVPSRAEPQSFQDRKAVEADGPFDLLGQVLVVSRTPGHVGGPGRCGHRAKVQGAFQLVEKPRPGPGVAGRGGRALAAGHAEIEIVEHQQGDVEVAPAGGQQVGAADAQAPVAHGDHDRQFRTRQFEARRVGQGPAVKAVHGVGVEKGVEEARAADVADNGDLVAGQAHVGKGPVQGPGDLVVGAPGTKDRRAFFIEQAGHRPMSFRSGGE